MNKGELKVLIIIVVFFAIIGGIFFGIRSYLQSKEEEYVPEYLQNGGKIESIKPKVYGVNEYSIVNVEEKELSFVYLNDFYTLMRTDVTLAYQLLEDDFRKEHFKTLAQFQEFVNQVLMDSNSLKITTNTFYSSKNGNVYDIITESGIHYFFTAEGVMTYRVRFENK